MKYKKILTNILCIAMVLNNITPAMATYMEQGYTYTEEEETVSKKTEVIYENGIGNYFVKIPKIISLGAEKACKYSVQVKGDIASDKMVYVSPIDSIEESEATDFYMLDQSTVNPKENVPATVSQNKLYWNFKDVADEYTETENNISAPDLSAGTWKGTFNFEINLLNDDGSVIVHDYVGKVLKTASCTEDGEKLYTCSDCGQSYTEILPATGHNLVNGVCSECETSVQSVSEIEETDTYETGTVVSKPENGKLTINGEEITNDSYTFTETGTYEITIETLDDTGDISTITKTITVEEHNHNYTEKVLTAPTCVDEGEKELSCSCGSKKYEVLPATGHNMVDGKCSKCHVTVKTPEDLISDDIENEDNLVYDTGTIITIPEDAVLKVDGIIVPENNYTFTEEGEYDVQIQTTDPVTGESVVINKHITVGSHAHNYSETILLDSTCVDLGEKRLTCSCGSIKYEVIPAKGHNIQNDRCTNCNVIVKTEDDFIYDSEENEDSISYEVGTVISVPDNSVLKVDGEIISEGSYTFNEEGTHTVEIETTENGETVVTEKEVVIGSHTHNYKESIIKSSTCTETGEKKLSCSCGSVKTEEISALGHDITDNVCTRCGVIIKTEADIQDKEEVTYTEGTAITVPENSVLTINGEIISDDSYTFDEEGIYEVIIETKDPVTGNVTTTETKVSITAHSHNYSETILEEANCVENGEKELICSCGSVKYEVIPATGHEIIENKCTKCEVTIKTENDIISDSDNTENKVTYEAGTVITLPKDSVLKVDGVIVNENPYTFTEEGTHTITIETTNPETEKKTITRKEVTIESHEHKYAENVTKEATCTENGEKRLTCTCGSVKYEVIEALGHDYSSNFTTDKEATCTETGEKSQHCSRCDSKSEVTSIPAKGHSYDLGVVTTQPTCTEKGVKTFTCTVCGFTRTEDVSALGHDYSTTDDKCTRCNELRPDHEHNYSVTDTIEATCTETGKNTLTCKCGDVQYETLSALGHDYSTAFIVDKAETCTETGSKSKHCSRCDSKSEVTSIPAKGHSYSSNFTIDKEATCTEEGSKSKHCTRCDSKTEITSISITGHSFAWKNITNGTYRFSQDCNIWRSTNSGENDTEATSEWNICLSNTTSYIIEYHVSSEENYDKLCIWLDDNEIVKESGEDCNGSYTATLSAGIHTLKATYSKDGSVGQYDDEAYIRLSYIGSGTITKQPTCTETGTKDYVCANCGTVGTEILSTLEHDYIDNSNISYWTNTDNGDFYFVQDGDKWKSNNKDIILTASSQWSITVNEDIEYSFKYRVSSEESWDKLTIKLDDEQILDVSGDGKEETYTTTLSKGMHTLSATYSKDSGFQNEDMAYLILPNAGEGKHICSVCGKEETCTYDEGTVVKPATCTETGTTTYKCIYCNGTKIKSTNILPHNYVNDICTIGGENRGINNWNYTLNDTNNTITLNYCLFNEEDVYVDDHYTIHGKSYKTQLANNEININNHNYPYMFMSFHSEHKLKSITFSKNLDTSNLTNIRNMFESCVNLTSLDLSMFNVSNVTDMSGMFYNCRNLTAINLDNWNTNNLIDMHNMFSNCGFTNLNINNFNTNKVTDMSNLFYNCTELIALDLSNWDTSNVTNMSYMFGYCNKLTTLNISSFNTSKVTNMEQMFWNCLNLIELNLSHFDVSNVTDMSGMFQMNYNSKSTLITLDLSNWNTSNATDMSYMFYNCSNLKTIYVTSGKWSTSKANKSGMFSYCGTSSVTYK